jgi:hypothetical protein
MLRRRGGNQLVTAPEDRLGQRRVTGRQQREPAKTKGVVPATVTRT